MYIAKNELLTIKVEVRMPVPAASGYELNDVPGIYMAIWSQRIVATLVACVAETPR